MAIAQLPDRKRRGGTEKSAVQFIEGATPSPGKRKATGADSEAEGPRQVTMIRFVPSLLRRIDQAARRHGISRSAWIAFTLSKVLNDEERKGA